jgi:hypothetical protein
MKDFNGCRCDDGWKAWIDTMPPSRNVLRVEGSCTCQDGGHKLRLTRAKPQGTNPEILILRIEDQPDSEMPHHPEQYPLKYTEDGAHYQQVTILPCEITIDVSIIS